MSKSYPIVERHADGVIVTARSVVEAQQAAGEALGGDCTITSVEKVREGGVGGFFATELMRVSASPSRFRSVERELSHGMSSAEELLTSMRDRSPQFVDRLISELRQTGGQTGAAAGPTEKAPAFIGEDVTDALPQPAVPRTLVERIEQSQAAAAATPPPVVHAVQQPVPQPVPPVVITYQAPAPTFPAATNPAPNISAPPAGAHPAAMQPVIERPDSRWSHQSLRALGLPDRIVDAAQMQRPASESEWIVALMGAFGRLCGPVPQGPTVMIGPSCANLARQLKLVSVGTEELAESISSVAVPHITAKITRFARNDRLVHLMIGGTWHHLSGVDAQIVSAATPGDLLEAIRVCTAWDAVLGWCWSGTAYDRLDQFTVVSQIRTILYGNEQQAPAERAMAYA